MATQTMPKWEVHGPNVNGLQIRHGNLMIAEIRDNITSIDEDNAKLIAAAPDLLEAVKLQGAAIDHLFAKIISLKSDFYPTKSGLPWTACLAGNAAIKKADGGK